MEKCEKCGHSIIKNILDKTLAQEIEEYFTPKIFEMREYPKEIAKIVHDRALRVFDAHIEKEGYHKEIMILNIRTAIDKGME